jgi:hypothetical protein
MGLVWQFAGGVDSAALFEFGLADFFAGDGAGPGFVFGRHATSGLWLLGRALAGLQVEDAFFEGCYARIGVGVAGLQAVHSGEVASGKLLDASQDFGLHVAHGF